MIRIQDVSHVSFRAPDLDKMAIFLADFGMTSWLEDSRLYARGLGTEPFIHVTELGEPGFVALGLRAACAGDLELLAHREGVSVEKSSAPGGGLVAVLTDPDGYRIEVVSEQVSLKPTALPEAAGWNSAREKNRLRMAKRTGLGAAHVVRLGHCVLGVSNFRASEQWYKDRFGFITSDEIAVNEKFSLGAFMRCDRGDQPTDHHSLFLMQTPRGVGFDHAAFEVLDMDDLLAGHARLRQQGWDPHWGVGRHLLGSQVFDYWRDPWGNTLEHWTDGDLLTAADGSKVAPLTDLLAVQWGPGSPRAGADRT